MVRQPLLQVPDNKKAADGSRTRLSGLGSQRTTDVLQPHSMYILRRMQGFFNHKLHSSWFFLAFLLHFFVPCTHHIIIIFHRLTFLAHICCTDDRNLLISSILSAKQADFHSIYTGGLYFKSYICFFDQSGLFQEKIYALV